MTARSVQGEVNGAGTSRIQLIKLSKFVPNPADVIAVDELNFVPPIGFHRVVMRGVLSPQALGYRQRRFTP